MKEEYIEEARDIAKKMKEALCAEITLNREDAGIWLKISAVGSESFTMPLLKDVAGSLVRTQIGRLWQRAQEIGLRLDVEDRAHQAYELRDGSWKAVNRFGVDVGVEEKEPTHLKRTNYNGVTVNGTEVLIGVVKK